MLGKERVGLVEEVSDVTLEMNRRVSQYIKQGS